MKNLRGFDCFASFACIVPLLAGCVSPSPNFERVALGPNDPPAPQPPFEVTLEALTPQVRRGEPVRLVVKIRNISDSSAKILARPIVAFAWTYPNGHRDNTMQFMPDTVGFQESDLQTLNPGEELLIQREISTRYFPTTGPTVFRAILYIPTNTNPGVGTIPSGRWRSNAFGVAVVD